MPVPAVPVQVVNEHFPKPHTTPDTQAQCVFDCHARNSRPVAAECRITLVLARLKNRRIIRRFFAVSFGEAAVMLFLIVHIYGRGGFLAEAFHVIQKFLGFEEPMRFTRREHLTRFHAATAVRGNLNEPAAERFDPHKLSLTQSLICLSLLPDGCQNTPNDS